MKMNLNKVFDKIYVITYESNITKNNYMKSLLDSKKLDFEFFMGADGTKLGQTLYEQGYNKELKISQLCCSLSHYYLYLKIKEEKQNNVLILEDDVYFMRDDITDDEVTEINNTNWDILYLGFNNSHVNFNNYMKQKLINGNLLRLNECRYSSRDTFFEGTSSLIIKKYETVDFLIDNLNTPEKLHVIDGVYNKLIANDTCSIYALNPQVFSQI